MRRKDMAMPGPVSSADSGDSRDSRDSGDSRDSRDSGDGRADQPTSQLSQISPLSLLSLLSRPLARRPHGDSIYTSTRYALVTDRRDDDMSLTTDLSGGPGMWDPMPL